MSPIHKQTPINMKRDESEGLDGRKHVSVRVSHHLLIFPTHVKSHAGPVNILVSILVSLSYRNTI